MISRLTGTITELTDEGVVLTVGGIGYEVMTPSAIRPQLAERLRVPETTLYTLQYLEGTPGKGNLVPRIVGFLSTREKDFFELFTTVDGIGNRKALRAMAAPIHLIAQAIEGRDARRLSDLPEIGKRTAEKVIAQLHGKVQDFAWPDGAEKAATADARPAFPQFAADALEVLLQLGEKPQEAEDWLQRALKARPDVNSSQELINEVYRIKAGRR